MADYSPTVSGGVGGIGANLDDMETESKALEEMTGRLLLRGRSAGSIAVDSNLVASAVLSPVTAAEAEKRILGATGVLVVSATEAGASALYLGGAVTAYRTADQAIAALVTIRDNTITFVGGALALPLAIAALPLALADGVGTVLGAEGEELIDAIHSGKPFDQNEANAFMKAALGSQLDLLKGMLTPQLLDIIADGAPGLLSGLILVLDVTLGPAATDALLTGITGVPWPPTDYKQAVLAIIGGGNAAGLLVDGEPITPGSLMTAGGNPPLPPLDAKNIPSAAGSLNDLLLNSSDIDIEDQDNTFARIRITAVGSPPSYIVQIPSTQSWYAKAGLTPNDLTADLQAMAGRQTALESAVVAAMQRAGISSTAPVMLEGFSLGGITAGQMAADPSLHYNITNVVTAGSPIANFDIPKSVKVLSMEFNQDPVAQLDGHENPSSSNWTTVKADAPPLKGEDGVAPGMLQAHDSDRYALLARQLDSSTDPSVLAFKNSASRFLGPDATPTDYGAQR